ncbi:NUDIX hydrolase [Sulfolobus islandicus L.S.2.15]|uniref:NUDIX hydrolase n=4 Tax=Saccharolobus islandicus TaxID=43080 RepID=C3MJG6_SACI2|nr:NUDIX hydrolase [Sulfolobus islandicus L.S.2.15]ACP47288.1 NUDIX hydrolase [Sulfolobus islandicus Y.N.15.51]ADB85892.1 NUDIX hydrolase [Sulfolobus islandicus L.D.8.5]
MTLKFPTWLLRPRLQLLLISYTIHHKLLNINFYRYFMDRPLVAVGCLIVEENKVLLVKRKNPPNAGLWAIPGGKVEYGETLEDALKREMREETGLEVAVSNIISIVQVINEGYHYVILDFECKPIGGKLRASSDASEVEYIPFNKLKDIPTTKTTYDMLIMYFKGEKPPYSIIQISK